jgi:hypothetical protein
MTYGWMLLVIAIVGALLFALFQDQELESQSVEGFEGEDVRVEDVASGNGSVQLELASYSSEGLSDVRVCVSNSSRSFCSGSLSLERLGSETLGFPANESGESFTYDVNASFTSDSGIPDSVSGSLTVDAFVTGSPSGSNPVGGEGPGDGPDGGGGDGPDGGGGGVSAANFTIEDNVVVSPSSPEVGDTVSFNFTVDNTGDGSGVQEVNLTINGSERDSTSVSLGAGKDKDRSLSWSTGSGDAGPFDYSVSSENDSVSGDSSLSTADTGTSTVVGEDFEDGSLSNYDVYNDSYWTLTNTIEGTRSVKLTGTHNQDNGQALVSYEGGNLDYYPQSGDIVSVLIEPNSTVSGFAIGIRDGATVGNDLGYPGVFAIAQDLGGNSGANLIGGKNQITAEQVQLSNLDSRVYELQLKWYNNALVGNIYNYSEVDGRKESILSDPIKVTHNGSINNRRGFAWTSLASQGEAEYDYLRKLGEVNDPDKTVVDLALSGINGENNPLVGNQIGYKPDIQNGQWGETVNIEYEFQDPNGTVTTKTDSFTLGETKLQNTNYLWNSSGTGYVNITATYNGSSDYTISETINVDETISQTLVSNYEGFSEYESTVNNMVYENPGLVQNNEEANYTSNSFELQSNTGIQAIDIEGKLQSSTENPDPFEVQVSSRGGEVTTSHDLAFTSTELQTKTIDLSSTDHEGNIRYLEINPPNTDFYSFSDITVELLP